MSKNQRDRLEKRVAAIELELPKLEDELAKLTAELSEPEVIADYERLQKVTEAFRQKENDIQKLLEEWESSSSDLA